MKYKKFIKELRQEKLKRVAQLTTDLLFFDSKLEQLENLDKLRNQKEKLHKKLTVDKKNNPLDTDDNKKLFLEISALDTKVDAITKLETEKGNTMAQIKLFSLYVEAIDEMNKYDKKKINDILNK